MPKCGVRRRRVRSSPWLSLLGDHRVSGGGLLGGRETKRTHRRERGERVARHGSSEPTGSDRFRSSRSFSGKATCVRRTDATPGGLHIRGGSTHGGSRVCA